MTIAGLVLLVVLAMAGAPIYLAILLCALIILIGGEGIDPITPMTVMFNRLSQPMLLAVPLFVLLGQILAFGGSGKPLIRLLNAFMGHLPGGPAYALVFASIMVAAMCPTEIAAVAAFGPLIIPTLVGLGYSERFAVGLLIGSATLAPLIPPNIVAIIYSYIASPLVPGQYISVTSLWTACIIPGVIITFLLCAAVFIYSRRGHYERLPRATWTERWEAIKEAWPVALTPLVILGPLYADWATPTEVGALGLAYVTLISIFIYRGFTLKSFWQTCTSTLGILGVIFLIIMAAVLLNIAVTYAKVPQDVADWITDMGLNWWSFMGMLIIVYTIMGMFLDPTAIVLVSVPILMSSVIDLEISVITFGVFSLIAVNLAGITPPYGLTIFACQSIMAKPYIFVVRACLMFYPAIFIGMCFVGFIPSLTTWLPDVTGR